MAQLAERKEVVAAAPERVRREIKASEPIPRKTHALSSKEPKPVRWWTPSYRSKQKVVPPYPATPSWGAGPPGPSPGVTSD